ncbi:unnamed protein product [Bemisia tabaci]|uniref:Ribonuclease P protein subunit p20 n=1 Tax=Bemisia tabaci TaxID=7038 RepID=A0A9P0EVK8_BEMTA|nr:PREDICTED: ribonuclease P protein subunit p20 [Bemisia tabaci]CAH0380925.1 unnamed protein product [Bemisia tabaci]
MDHARKKRPPPRGEKKENEFYVTNKSDFKGQLSKCEKLLSSENSFVILHGLGHAVLRTISLALELQRTHYDTLEIHVNTSTIDLVDDLEPLNDESEYEVQTRQNSAVHILIKSTVKSKDKK